MPLKDPIARRHYLKKYNANRAEKDREYRVKRKDDINTRRRWRYGNIPEFRDRKRLLKKLWWERNPEYRKKCNARLAVYFKTHPEKWVECQGKRRASKLKSTANSKSISEYMARIRESAVVRCYYCDGFIPGKMVHFDHIVALANGGPHSIGNICVSCPKCNQSKNDSPIVDWLKLGQQILNL